jgi:hypothetical protein
MLRLLVTAFPTPFDVVQLEPTLEALYYQYPNCQLTLSIWEGYVPFFEHHPLIYEIHPSTEECPSPSGADIEAEYDVIVNIPNIQAWPVHLPTVEKFAASVETTLLRKTPKIFLDEYPEDSDKVVLARVPHRLNLWPDFAPEEALHPNYETLHLNPAVCEYRETLRTLASATLVVGPDNWMTQAAAALDTRVVMGMPTESNSEVLRAPFNVVITSGHKESVIRSVKETLFEKRYPDFLNSGNAAEYIKLKAKMYMKSGFADVGCSAWPISNGIPVDTHNREVIEDAPDGVFSGVFSSHCLEHIIDWHEELTLWHRIMRRSGVMFLYLPHPRCEPWQALTGSWVGKNHVWNPEPLSLVRFLKEGLGMRIIDYTSRRDPLWSFYVIARKI